MRPSVEPVCPDHLQRVTPCAHAATPPNAAMHRWHQDEMWHPLKRGQQGGVQLLTRSACAQCSQPETADGPTGFVFARWPLRTPHSTLLSTCRGICVCRSARTRHTRALSCLAAPPRHRLDDGTRRGKTKCMELVAMGSESSSCIGSDSHTLPGNAGQPLQWWSTQHAAQGRRCSLGCYATPSMPAATAGSIASQPGWSMPRTCQWAQLGRPPLVVE